MRIGLFCSGGDAPGMNACVRAVVRSAVEAGHEVVGILRGYQGLLDEDFFVDADGQRHMSLRSVSGIAKLGGTILYSSRSDEFRTEAGQKRAAGILEKHQIDALIPIGGDGTFRGAIALSRCWRGQIITCPATIRQRPAWHRFHDRVCHRRSDRRGSRRQAARHGHQPRADVLSRNHAGLTAASTSASIRLAAGEVATFPRRPPTFPRSSTISTRSRRGKKSIMVIVSEGDEHGGAMQVDQAAPRRLAVRDSRGDARSSQRGGSRLCRPNTGGPPRRLRRSHDS